MIRRISILIALLVAAPVFINGGLPLEKKNQIEHTLSSVPAPELPARVVSLVNESSEADRLDTTRAAIRIVAKKRPAAVATVVAALSRANPELSVAASGAAADAVPAQRANIALAAATAAPDFAPTISIVTKSPVAPPSSSLVAAKAGDGNGKGHGYGKINKGGTLPNGKPHPGQGRGLGPKPPKPVPYNRPHIPPGPPHDPPGPPDWEPGQPFDRPAPPPFQGGETPGNSGRGGSPRR